MNILLDFLTLHRKTGAGEYARRIFSEILVRINSSDLDTELYALYDSQLGIAYDDLSISVLSANGHSVKFVDCHIEKIDAIVQRYNIDLFVIACGQNFSDHPEIANIRCRSICVIHDLYAQDFFQNNILEYRIIVSRWNMRKVFGYPLMDYLTFAWRVLKSLGRLLYIRFLGGYDYQIHNLLPVVNLIGGNCKTLLG